MFDLHCHMLPAIDDGAVDLGTAIAMARIAEADGITHVACTPHIYPGMFENDAAGIRQVAQSFSDTLKAEGISLAIGIGADTHLVPGLLDGLRTGRIPSLNGSRYFLLEPSHHVAPPRFTALVLDLLASEYVPVITHPERLTWLGDHYEDFRALVQQGVWIQLTAGSLTGRFGKSPQYWAQKMLDDGIVHILATDAHNLKRRAPLLAEGREEAAKWVGEKEAGYMVYERTKGIWEDVDPMELPPALVFQQPTVKHSAKTKGFFGRLVGR